MEVRRTREGRRTMKLLMTPETENAGISGELRFLVRARGDLEVCGSPSQEGRAGGNNDELLFARERVGRGLGDCPGAVSGGRVSRAVCLQRFLPTVVVSRVSSITLRTNRVCHVESRNNIEPVLLF